MKAKTIQKLVSGLLIGVGVALVVFIISEFSFLSSWFEGYELGTYDLRMRYKAELREDETIEDIVIVDIDGRSFDKLGKKSQWPMSYYPNLIDHLSSSGAKVVGFDVIFDPDRDSTMNQQFVESTQNAGNVYHAITFVHPDSDNFIYAMETEPEGFNAEGKYFEFDENVYQNFYPYERIELSFKPLINAAKSVGFVNSFRDIDGVDRRRPLFVNFNGHAYPTFALRMAMDILGVDDVEVIPGDKAVLKTKDRTINIPIDENGQMLINYIDHYKAFRYVSFYDVMKRRIRSRQINDRIFIVGTSLYGLGDLVPTPVQEAYPGVETHATVLYNILNNDFMSEAGLGMVFSILMILAFLTAGIGIMLKPKFSIPVTVLFIISYIGFAYYTFLNNNQWYPMATPIMTIFLTYLGIYIYRYSTEEKDKRVIRGIFSHYVTKSVVDKILENPDSVKLGGEKKHVTTLFSDIAGFTTVSEQLKPEELVKLLNHYLTEMTNIILEKDGTLDKYEGDAIMAFFGAPVPIEDHAYVCCAVALEMQEKLSELRPQWIAEGKPDLRTRIGVNSGDVVVGNMGSERRFDYTVMGDAVNLSSRLEGANKEYRTYIMMGENTYELVKDKIESRQLDLLRVKGKYKPVRVYEILARKSDGLSDDMRKVVELYEKGLQHYFNQEWDEAIDMFDEALDINPDDGPSDVYLERCETFKDNPPPKDWDGVYVMTSK